MAGVVEFRAVSVEGDEGEGLPCAFRRGKFDKLGILI